MQNKYYAVVHVGPEGLRDKQKASITLGPDGADENLEGLLPIYKLEFEAQAYAEKLNKEYGDRYDVYPVKITAEIVETKEVRL